MTGKENENRRMSNHTNLNSGLSFLLLLCASSRISTKIVRVGPHPPGAPNPQHDARAGFVLPLLSLWGGGGGRKGPTGGGGVTGAGKPLVRD